MNTEKSPALDVFAQWKNEEACLSQRKIAMLACGDTQADSATTAHLNTCADCAAQLLEEEAAFRAAAYVAVPADLRAKFDKRQKRTSWLTGAVWLATGVCAVAVLAVFIPSASLDDSSTSMVVSRTKGHASLVLSVMRSGQIVVDEMPAETMNTLREGDRLRLRVVGAEAGSRTTLQGWEDGHWQTYFTGVLPEDHWLPTGIRIDNKGENRLRLEVCDSNGKCAEQIYSLR